MSPELRAEPHQDGSTGAPSHQRRGRRVAGRVSIAAALAAVGLLAAACGGGTASSGVARIGSATTTTVPTSGASPSPSSVDAAREQKLAYAQCMQRHGDSGFPDPGISNNISAAANASALSSEPGYAAANKICDHLLPHDGGPPTAAETQQELRQALRYVQCMRAHGLPNMADPTVEGGSLHLSPPAGVDKSSPTFQHAIAACRPLLVGAGGP